MIRFATAAAVALAAVTVVGCSSAGPAPGRSTSAPSSAAPTTSSAPVTTAPAPVPSSSAVTSAAPSATASTVAPTSSAPTSATPRSTCTAITIRVIRGSAAPGFEFAALQFVNSGTTRCVLNGYPTVTLRAAGATVGTPSKPASAANSTYALAPGAVAESRLKDFSTCQAPLSDSITVVAPGSTVTLTRPGQLRACELRVYPLAAPE